MFQKIETNRPDTINKNLAITCSKEKTIKFTDTGYTTAKEAKSGDNLIDTPCKPLQSIFDDLGITHIDFFSLDVESKEFEA